MDNASNMMLCPQGKLFDSCGCHVDHHDRSVAGKVNLCALGTLFGLASALCVGASVVNPLMVVPAAVFGVSSGVCFIAAFTQKSINHYCATHQPQHMVVHGQSAGPVIIHEPNPTVIVHNEPTLPWYRRVFHHRPHRPLPGHFPAPRVPVGHRRPPIRSAAPIRTAPVPRPAPSSRVPVGYRAPVSRPAPAPAFRAPVSRPAPIRTAPAQRPAPSFRAPAMGRPVDRPPVRSAPPAGGGGRVPAGIRRR